MSKRTISSDREPSLLCIAHRGASGHEPENTLRAIRKALSLGAPWIEIDVYLVDGELVVFHDDRLERTSNGKGYVQQQSFAYLRSLDAGKGEQIPTLQEVCETVGQTAGINVELKGAGTAVAVSEELTKLVERGWSNEQFLVSSFDHRQLQELRRLRPQTKLGVLICSLPIDDAAIAEQLGAFSLHASLEFVDKRLVDDAHRRGLKVFVYTVNHPEDIQRMRELGVDGVFTDYPERVLSGSSE